MSKKIVAGVIIPIVALVVCFAPIKTAAYTVTVDYQDTETYYEAELQEVTEPLKYQLGYGFGGGPHCSIINRDSIAGYFDICCPLYIMDEDTWYDLRYEYGKNIDIDVFKAHSQVYKIEGRVYLEPGEKGEVKCSWDDIEGYHYNSGDRYEGFWNIYPEEITKTKPVQVEKQRTVTKQRPETRYKKVTLLDYLLHY